MSAWSQVISPSQYLTVFMTLFFSLKDRVKKLIAEKEALESHLKNEKDEKELYKVMH